MRTYYRHKDNIYYLNNLEKISFFRGEKYLIFDISGEPELIAKGDFIRLYNEMTGSAKKRGPDLDLESMDSGKKHLHRRLLKRKSLRWSMKNRVICLI